MTRPLPPTCERALLEQFLKAESMALWLVRSAQTQNVPPDVLQFLRRHEEEESRHLQRFEQLLGMTSRRKTPLRVPSQWCVLAVQLYGYEALGHQFARLLVALRPDLHSILDDEEVHVQFFENEVRKLLVHDGSWAEGARQAARAWRRRLPRTVDRYLDYQTLTPFRDDLRQFILDAIDERFSGIQLLPGTEDDVSRIA
jgi:predicted component of type VI protein secretion system